jgi:acetolactate synthase-1/2/3 large subunit
MTGSTYISESLKQAGLTTVFGIPSYVGMQQLAALAASGLKIALNTHEQNAAHMAEGYYLATGKPAIVSLAIGPGLTNALTGIANAYCESVPMIILAGRAAKSWWGRNEYHAQSGIGRTINEKQMIEALVKAAYYPNTIEELKQDIKAAIEEMLTGRPGPVYLSIPQELQTTEAQSSLPTIELKQPTITLDKDLLAQFEAIYENSAKPVLMFGGEISSDSKQIIRQLMDQNCPYFTSYTGKGKVPILPNYLGTLWYCNSAKIIETLKQADLLVVVGDHLTHFTSRLINAMEDKPAIIQISENQDEIGRVFPVKLGIQAFVPEWLSQINLSHKPWYQPSAKELTLKDFSTLAVIQRLGDLAPKNSVFMADVGNAGYAAITDLWMQAGQEFYTPGKFGACGWSTGAAMGYAYGNSERPVMSIVGDLSLLMNGQELANVKKLGTHNTFLVFNNGVPQNITQDQEKELGQTIQAEVPKVDYQKLAESFGLNYSRITNLDELTHFFNQNDFNHNATIVEIVVDKQDYPLDG